MFQNRMERLFFLYKIFLLLVLNIHNLNPSCGAHIEEQSKAGECCLYVYAAEDVPTDIADDIIGTTIECENCSSVFKILEYVKEPVVTKSLVCVEV